MKKEFVDGCPVWASIYDGHTHIERRVYVDENGNRYVRINGGFVECDWLMMRDEVGFYF